MDDRTLEALRGSIKKWEKIVEGTGEDAGTDNCPLCHLFYNDDEIMCKGCPVAEAVDFPGCVSTPYMLYYDNPTKENAQRELDFLISLLPPGVSKDA
jgi:hypothetical protein